MLGFTDVFVVLKLVFHLVLGTEEQQPVLVAAISISFLVPHVLLLKCTGIFEDLQAIKGRADAGHPHGSSQNGHLPQS